MIGYRNCVYNQKDKNVIIYTWDKEGNRISFERDFKPYLYLEHTFGEEKSIFGTNITKREFETNSKRKDFIERSGNKRFFDNYKPAHQALLDIYGGNNHDEDFSKFPLKIYFLDIESVGEGEFAKPANPEHPINVITIYDTLSKTYQVMGLQPYYPKSPDVDYKYFRTETALLEYLIEYLRNDPPDILSGWHSSFYDIPYIINRIERVLGPDSSRRLSPTGRVFSYEQKAKFGGTDTVYIIDGLSCVDYKDLYEKFCMTKRESYKLDYIGEIELKENKLDYGDISLYEFMTENWEEFVDYNIQDVKLLARLEEKLKYLELLRKLAYIGCSPFEYALKTVGVVTGVSCIFARKMGKRMATFERGESVEFVGGYVAEPKTGLRKSIVTFDANSLYPNVLLSLNMSLETKLGRILESNNDIVRVKFTSGYDREFSKKEFQDYVKIEKIVISKANILFSQKKRGIFADIMDVYYAKRVEVRKKAKELKFKNIDSKDPVIEDEISRLDTEQQAIKIFLNSLYGALANKFCSVGDEDIAVSITKTGQAVIKESSAIFKRFVTEKTGITDPKILEEALIYNDTDSVEYDTIIKTNKGDIKIGELYDQYNNSNIDYSTHGHEMLNIVNDLKCLTYDSTNKSVKMGGIKRLVRHKVSKGRFKIKVGGKEVIMTEDHGCMVIRDGKLIRVCPREIQKGDKMIKLL